jgi:hypothetical protein
MFWSLSDVRPAYICFSTRALPYCWQCNTEYKLYGTPCKIAFCLGRFRE